MKNCKHLFLSKVQLSKRLIHKRNLGFVLIITIGMVACDEILEKDISSKEIVMTSPINDAKINNTEVTFYWEEVLGASQYEMQIATGSFSDSWVIITDTIVNNTRISMPMKSGSFEWRLKAFNSYYSTKYFTQKFNVDTLNLNVKDISKSEILLLSPGNGAIIYKKNVFLCWEEVLGATMYHVQIVSPTFSQINKFLLDTTITNVKFTTPITKGKYEWRVKAKNSYYNSNYFKQAFAVDTPYVSTN